MEIGEGAMAEVVSSFWKNKKVFLTGHTGFKGSWLSLWLQNMGAELTGYALAPATNPSLFADAKLEKNMKSVIGDIRNYDLLKKTLTEFKPEIVIHMAAQPLVRYSYQNPIETYATNVMGTVHLLDSVRFSPSVRAVVNVTTDKCYENKEWIWPYRENESLGGYDPYSNSKACSELVTSAYRQSYFHPEKYSEHQVAIASARAGNVIGGGDWSTDRLIPDILRALKSSANLQIRNPRAIRPWQHVLEPLSGYLILAQNLHQQGARFSEAFNFGPAQEDVKDVEWITKKLLSELGSSKKIEIVKSDLHEAQYLSLDCAKAQAVLGWKPKWNVGLALSKIAEWNRAYDENPVGIDKMTLKQIEEYIRN